MNVVNRSAERQHASKINSYKISLAVFLECRLPSLGPQVPSRRQDLVTPNGVQTVSGPSRLSRPSRPHQNCVQCFSSPSPSSKWITFTQSLSLVSLVLKLLWFSTRDFCDCAHFGCAFSCMLLLHCNIIVFLYFLVYVIGFKFV